MIIQSLYDLCYYLLLLTNIIYADMGRLMFRNVYITPRPRVTFVIKFFWYVIVFFYFDIITEGKNKVKIYNNNNIARYSNNVVHRNDNGLKILALVFEPNSEIFFL